MSLALPRYAVAFDGERRLLRWTMRGLWTMADVQGLLGAFAAATAPLGKPPYRLDSLCDSRDFPVQTNEVSNALGKMNDYARTLRIGRTAIVVGSYMNKLQAQRTLIDEQLRIFLTLAEADAWLRQPMTDPA